MLFFGDLYVNRPYSLGPGLQQLVNRYDATVINFEGTLSLVQQPLLKAGPCKRMEERNLGSLSSFVDIAVLANNHVMDYQAEGLLQTIKWLKENKITPVGAGDCLKAAFQPLDLETIRLIAVAEHEFGGATIDTPGIATTEYDSLLRKLIQDGKQQGKAVVVVSHGGQKRSLYPHLIYENVANAGLIMELTW